jgi:hypothetical protein
MAGSSPSHYATWLQALQRFSILKKKTALPNIFDKYFRCKIQDGGLAVVNNQEHGQGVLTRSLRMFEWFDLASEQISFKLANDNIPFFLVGRVHSRQNHRDCF